MLLPRAQTRSEPYGQSPLICLPQSPNTSRPKGEIAKERRVRRRPGLRLLLLPWRRLVPLFGGRSGSLAGGGGDKKIPLGRRSGPRSQCPPEEHGSRPSPAPSGKKSRQWPSRHQAAAGDSPSAPAPELLTPDSTDGQTSLSPTLAPLPLLPSPRFFSPPLPLSRMPLRRPRIG